MSIALVAETFQLDLPHNQAWVLMAMSDIADDDGTNCFPSADYLAWKTGYSRAQTTRIIGELVKAGIVERVRSGRETGGSTEYRLHHDRAPRKAPFEPSGKRRARVQVAQDEAAQNEPAQNESTHSCEPGGGSSGADQVAHSCEPLTVKGTVKDPSPPAHADGEGEEVVDGVVVELNPEPDPVVEELCQHLAHTLRQIHELPAGHSRFRPTAKARRDMRKLVELRGAEQVRRCIDWLPNCPDGWLRDTGVQSPGSLAKHWTRLKNLHTQQVRGSLGARARAQEDRNRELLGVLGVTT